MSAFGRAVGKTSRAALDLCPFGNGVWTCFGSAGYVTLESLPSFLCYVCAWLRMVLVLPAMVVLLSAGALSIVQVILSRKCRTCSVRCLEAAHCKDEVCGAGFAAGWYPSLLDSINRDIV